MAFIVTVAGTHVETIMSLLKALTYHLIYDLSSWGVPAEVILVRTNEYGVKLTITNKPEQDSDWFMSDVTHVGNSLANARGSDSVVAVKFIIERAVEKIPAEPAKSDHS